MHRDLKVTELIPHRPPFLWVDSILQSDASSLLAEKTIPVDLDVFQGHYPEHPILPGVLLCEALFQTGALLISLLLRESKAALNGVPVITRIENAKFKRPVGPGDTIQLQVNIKEMLNGVWFLKGVLRIKGKVAVKTDFACTLAELP